MRPLFKNIILLVLSIALVFTALGILLQNYMQSREFIEKISRSFSDFLDGEMQVESAEINLLRGVALNQLSVTRPGGDPPAFLKVDGAYLNYNLLGIPFRELNLDIIRLQKPILTFAQTSDGDWWFPKSQTTRQAELDTGLLTFKIVLDDFALSDGEVRVVRRDQAVLLEATGIGIEGNLEADDRGIAAEGKLILNRLSLGSDFVISGMQSDLTYRNEVLNIPNLTGTAYGGTASGAIEIDLRLGDPEFSVALNLKRLDLESLLHALHPGASPLKGQLSTVFQLEGTFDQPERTRGTGTLKVEQGRLSDLDFFRDLKDLFQDQDIPETRFDDIIGSFKIADKILTLYNLEAVGENVQLTASGTVGASGQIDFDMRLTLSPSMASLLPAEIVERWNRRDDGTCTLTFKLTGTLAEPKSNFRDKLQLDTPTPEPKTEMAQRSHS